jgi:hypothetical protein
MTTITELREAPPTMFYVSQYEVDRCYGGAEEGGWWYDWYDFRRTVACYAIKGEAMAAARALNEQAREDRHGPDRFSVIGGPDEVYMVEDHPAEMQTTERPYYC